MDLAKTYATAYKLCKELRERDPSLFVSDGVAKQSFLKFSGQGDLTIVNNAGQLETWCGESMRASKMPEGILDGVALRDWLHIYI